jgi:hypothetical protein
MTIDLRRLFPALALAAFIAATAAGCAQSPPANAPPGSGTSVPDPTGGIDYHSGPYRMLNG